MASPKIRKPPQLPPSQAAPGFILPVSGIVVHKDALVAALRPFLPQLADIQPFEDGERFLFVFDSNPPAVS